MTLLLLLNGYGTPLGTSTIFSRDFAAFSERQERRLLSRHENRATASPKQERRTNSAKTDRRTDSEHEDRTL